MKELFSLAWLKEKYETPRYVAPTVYRYTAPEYRPSSGWGYSVSANDARYWVGSRSSYSTYSECRACRVTAWTLADRKKHMRETQCNKKLLAVYAQLRKEHLCGFCGESCGRRHWGLPLHTGCQERWMTEAPLVVRALLAGGPSGA